MKQTVIAIGLIALSSPAWANYYGSGLYHEVQSSVRYEDNLARSYLDRDDTSDILASVSYGLGYSQNHGDRTRYVIGGYVGAVAHDTYDDLDHWSGTIALDLTYQTGSGYTGPWLGFSSSLTYTGYADSEPREGFDAVIETSLNQRLGGTVTGHAGYRFRGRLPINQSEGEQAFEGAFDTRRHEIFVGLDYAPTDAVTLFAEYGYQSGDLTSSASAPPGDPTWYDAETPDHLFQDCLPANCTFYAYRVEADVHVVDVGIVYAPGPLGVELSAGYFEAESVDGLTYDDYVVRLGIIWSF